MLSGVNIRGEEIDVEFKQCIYEPDVNYSEVVWDFLPGDYERLKPTDAEIESIENQLWNRHYGKDE